MAANQEPFPSDRQNKDRLPDPICITRFATGTSAKSELQPPEHEKQYTWDSAFLAERGRFSPPL